MRQKIAKKRKSQAPLASPSSAGKSRQGRKSGASGEQTRETWGDPCFFPVGLHTAVRVVPRIHTILNRGAATAHDL